MTTKPNKVYYIQKTIADKFGDHLSEFKVEPHGEIFRLSIPLLTAAKLGYHPTRPDAKWKALFTKLENEEISLSVTTFKSPKQIDLEMNIIPKLTRTHFKISSPLRASILFSSRPGIHITLSCPTPPKTNTNSIKKLKSTLTRQIPNLKTISWHSTDLTRPSLISLIKTIKIQSPISISRLRVLSNQSEDDWIVDTLNRLFEAELVHLKDETIYITRKGLRAIPKELGSSSSDVKRALFWGEQLNPHLMDQYDVDYDQD